MSYYKRLKRKAKNVLKKGAKATFVAHSPIFEVANPLSKTSKKFLDITKKVHMPVLTALGPVGAIKAIKQVSSMTAKKDASPGLTMAQSNQGLSYAQPTQEPNYFAPPEQLVSVTESESASPNSNLLLIGGLAVVALLLLRKK